MLQAPTEREYSHAVPSLEIGRHICEEHSIVISLPQVPQTEFVLPWH